MLNIQLQARSGGDSGEWANGATSNTAATSGETEGSSGDLLKRRAAITRSEGDNEWATGSTSTSSAGSGSFDDSDADLLKRSGGELTLIFKMSQLMFS